MSRSLVFLAINFYCLLLIPETEQAQSTQTQLLLQLSRQLEYPKQIGVWNNTDNLCYLPPSPDVSVTCEGNFVTELKIVGDHLAKPRRYNGYSIPYKTLSQYFSVDSFVTTLTRLTSLKVVILVSLGIWGPLPDKIHRLYSLEVLDLSSNFLYGSIPAKISVMTKLQTFSLDGNYFNDTLPIWFDSLPNLTTLNLQRNLLKGPLPESITRAHKLTELALSGNNISGKIPMLSGLDHLEMLDLRDNRLESALPAMPSGLVTILLSKNSLSGEIPQQFGELTRLQHLDLSFNLLEGNPPAALFSLPNLTYLNLASNILSGSLTSSTTCSRQLGFVDISTNRLTGELPVCLSSNTRVVKINGNCLSLGNQYQHEPKYCEGNSTKKINSKSKDIGIMVAVIGGIALVVLVLLVSSVVFCRRNCQRAVAEKKLLAKPIAENSTSLLSSELLANARYISQAAKLGIQALPAYRVFSFEELKEATRNFEQSAYICEGSTGKVYKGRLENGTFVAIRCLALFKKYSIRNLKLRLDLLSKLRHPHLVCLLGHCIDNASDDSGINRVFLVYEYVPNGNLSSALSEQSIERALKWPDRLAVLIGVAKAIHFLHTGTIPGLFNNRLKANNILLDEHMMAKLSDYGLSIITEEIYRCEGRAEGQRTIQSKSPELEKVNVEDDVYSFGVILLKALIGPKTYERTSEYYINELVKSSGGEVDQKQILDPIVLASSTQESLSIIISITSKCLSLDSSCPSIEDVLWNLQYATQVQATADRDQKSDVASQA